MILTNNTDAQTFSWSFVKSIVAYVFPFFQQSNEDDLEGKEAQGGKINRDNSEEDVDAKRKQEAAAEKSEVDKCNTADGGVLDTGGHMDNDDDEDELPLSDLLRKKQKFRVSQSNTEVNTQNSV